MSILITLVNTQFGPLKVTPILGYIWDADSETGIRFVPSAIILEI